MTNELTAEKIIEIFDMKTLPEEGGYYAETYRSDEIISENALPERYEKSRCFSTQILYLLTPDSFSKLHKVNTDEFFHFYMGDPVQMLQLYPDRTAETFILGSDILKGMKPQLLVKRNVWQGAHLVKGGKFALLGCSVAPGFEFEDFQPADKESLIKKHPDKIELIKKLT